MVMVCAPMAEAVEFKAERVTLFSAELKEQNAVNPSPVPLPVNVAHEVRLVVIIIELGITILIFPVDERGSVMVITNV